MSNSFEFLQPQQKRIRSPRISLIIFLGSALIFSFLLVFTRIYTQSLQKEYDRASNQAKSESMRFVDQARSLLPDSMKISDLQVLSEEHNNAIGGARSAWTSFFNALEEVLPKTAAIISIKKPGSEEKSFAADERLFRLAVAVPDMETANSLYMKISENKAFESLSFNPSNNQNSTLFILVEISFRFNENYAQS